MKPNPPESFEQDAKPSEQDAKPSFFAGIHHRLLSSLDAVSAAITSYQDYMLSALSPKNETPSSLTFFQERPRDKKMPEMGFGTYIGIELKPIKNREERHHMTVQAILTALESGYRHLDLAQNYNNLDAVRDALVMAFKPVSEGGLGIKRDDVWITMKANCFDEAAINQLLADVGVDYFDLFLIHHPKAAFESIEEHWRCLSNHSKLKHIGVSNFYGPHLEALMDICEQEALRRPYANQIQLSLLVDEPEVRAFCESKNIRLIAYSPLGYQYASYWVDNEEVVRVASDIGSTPAQVALAALLKKGVAVIPQSTNPERIRENFAALEVSPRLTLEHMNELAKVSLMWGEDALNDTALESKSHAEHLSKTHGPKGI